MSSAADTWYDYRTVWAATPWLAVYFVVVVLVFLMAIFGTLVGGVFAILFVPSLAGAYVHHLMVMKRLGR
ncbi:hypothetical protein [Jatrophihabitans endophyticus]|uniref:hypothetical protein n=1 Tax=Jatrophihabitans endophyticus TaxID=1206085 RepID=UPI0019E8AEA1|nr:hypothetical protein [Jatrophihabitans endophyticus]MBE7190184.1 hypothetical protein [Jatrophihabitans endophyticus]